MKYVSTRGNAPILTFDDVLLTGLARDGGLYVPEHWPAFSAADIRSLRGLSYAALAERVMAPFMVGSLTAADLPEIMAETYGGFTHSTVAPLVQIGPQQWVMELFHGPTLAFKDYALQLVGRLFERVLKRRGQRMLVVGATSGDTGSAAIEACRDRETVDIAILHPHNRTSEVQRRQMTTVLSPNVRNFALEGTFDDCQDIVKALFNDHAFRDEFHLSAVNSINWARVMAQVAYYFAAAVALGAPDVPVVFSVPTGNFGNVFAGYVARKMGLPIQRLVVGSNQNDILTRFFATGAMTAEAVVPTLSPSMDIQVSSNFERLLFEVVGRDGQAVERLLTEFRSKGAFRVSPEIFQQLLQVFEARRFDDAATLELMKAHYHATGMLLDPHSAVGVGAARGVRGEVPCVSLATAHPAKFPDAVAKATGIHPALPPHLADLFQRPERYEVIANDVEAVRSAVRAFVQERRS